MAKAAWCKTDVISGYGEKTFKASTDPYKGRNARSTTITVTNQTGSKPSKQLNVSQQAQPLYITEVSHTPQVLPSSNPVMTVIGKTNAKALAFQEYIGDFVEKVELKVNGVAQTNTSDDPAYPAFRITGDPGASGEYTFEMKMYYYANMMAGTVEIETRAIAFSTDDFNADIDTAPKFSIKADIQGAASSLSLAPTSITIPAAGTAQSVKITSNDSWTIS